MAITTKEDFIQYCLRALGSPINNIDVTDEQILDRYDDALRKYQDHHYDATEKTFYKHLITQEDYDRKYITLPDNIVAVSKIVDIRMSTTSGSDANLFSVEYQFLLNQMHLLWSSGEIGYFEHTMQHLELMNQVLNGKPTLRYTKANNKLYVDVNWDKGMHVGSWVVIEAQTSLDPEINPRLFNDVWFKRYVTALIKRQWGDNLKKFSGVQMVGGITLNGQQLYVEAQQEIAELEEELRDTWEIPIDAIYMG